MGGHSVPLSSAPFTHRRTVYGFIDRQNLDGLFRTFDFASPDATSPRRFVTTVPQQALFLLNHPFVLEQAHDLATRIEVETPAPEPRVERLYQAILQRPPDAHERALGLSFAGRAFEPDAESRPAWQYGFGTIDESAGRVTRFTTLTHWTGNAWQYGPSMPDASPAGFLHLTEQGGHVGRDADHLVIRRWVAPRDLTVAIEGTLRHDETNGNGVRARIVSSRSGVLGAWTAHKKRAGTRVASVEVKQGDTLDFVVDGQGDDSYDTFAWAPTIRSIGAGTKDGTGDGAGANAGPLAWSARSDFQGPAPAPLSAWEAYAQVLLLSNEFIFLD